MTELQKIGEMLFMPNPQKPRKQLMFPRQLAPDLRAENNVKWKRVNTGVYFSSAINENKKETVFFVCWRWIGRKVVEKNSRQQDTILFMDSQAASPPRQDLHERHPA